MTPKTQSVCKHCGKAKNSFAHLPIKGPSQFDHHEFEPVAEPASTGEQPLTELIDQYWGPPLKSFEPARPSEPAAPQASAERRCTCPTTQWTGSEPNDSSCELTEEEHLQLDQAAAAPSVAGTQPTPDKMQQEMAGLRFRIHNLERHNQYFFRCESAWCHPADKQFQK